MRVAAALLLVETLVFSTNAGGVERASSSGSSILRAASRAMGRLGTNATIEAVGQIKAEGRTGSYSETVRMRDGAFVARSRYTMFGDAEGYDGRIRWRQ